MKLRRFAILVEAARADQLAGRVSSDLISAIKKMTPKEVKRLLDQFVPLDFIALLKKENPGVFEAVLKDKITRLLSSDQHEKWIAELNSDKGGYTKEEAVNDVYAFMLNNDPDPRRRGILDQIIGDGSNSDKYEYARKSNPLMRTLMRKSLAPLSSGSGSGIVVPFCPVDKGLGITHPLWNISSDGGTAEIEEGLESNRCTQEEVIGEMSLEEFNALEETKQGLTSQQKSLLQDGRRTLEYEDGVAVLRCTFEHQLPKFQNFLRSRTTQAIKSVLDPERHKMGRTIPPAKYKRRNELEEKKRLGILTKEERIELASLVDYFQKKQVGYVYTPTSLDAPAQSSEGEGQTGHEKIVKEEDSSEVTLDDAHRARFELERAIGDKEFSVIAQVAQKVPLNTLMMKFKEIMDLSAKDPKKRVLEKEAILESIKIAQKYFGGGKESTNKCNTCGAELPADASTCPHANEMRKAIFSNYKYAKDIKAFEKFMLQVGPKSQEHYEKSAIPIKMNSVYGGFEVDEDDLGDIDLSGFESYKDESPAKASKLNETELQEAIERGLTEKQKMSYLGTDLAGATQVDEGDMEQVNQLAKYLTKIVQNIFIQELENDLGTFLMVYGVFK